MTIDSTQIQTLVSQGASPAMIAEVALDSTPTITSSLDVLPDFKMMTGNTGYDLFQGGLGINARQDGLNITGGGSSIASYNGIPFNADLLAPYNQGMAAINQAMGGKTSDQLAAEMIRGDQAFRQAKASGLNYDQAYAASMAAEAGQPVAFGAPAQPVATTAPVVTQQPVVQQQVVQPTVPTNVPATSVLPATAAPVAPSILDTSNHTEEASQVNPEGVGAEAESKADEEGIFEKIGQAPSRPTNWLIDKTPLKDKPFVKFAAASVATGGMSSITAVAGKGTQAITDGIKSGTSSFFKKLF